MGRLSTVARIISEPAHALRVGFALTRGTCYILYYRLFRRHVTIHFPFKAFGDVTIVGPGSVEIDRNCSVITTLFRGLTIVTLHPGARVRVGPNGHIGGLAIRCRGSITIGAEVWTAGSLVQDTLLLERERARCTSAGTGAESMPITIGDNVWLAAQCITLGGCRIGTDSVVGAGAVCLGSEVAEASVVFGNPGKRPLPIDRVLQMRGET